MFDCTTSNDNLINLSIAGFAILSTMSQITFADTYVALVERQRGDGLMYRCKSDSFQQAGVAVCSRRARHGRRSQNHIPVYEAFDRTQEHDIHDSSN